MGEAGTSPSASGREAEKRNINLEALLRTEDPSLLLFGSESAVASVVVCVLDCLFLVTWQNSARKGC